MTVWDWSIDGWIVLTGILSACSCAILGNYLVLRKLSLMGDAISHAVLPGLAIAFLLTESRDTWPMFVGAIIVGAFTALFTQLITDYGKVEHGAAMGVVFSILFAVGLVLIRQAADHVDLDPGCVLYGNIVQVPLDAIGGEVPPVVWRLGMVLGLNLLFVICFYKELKLSAFDPELSTTLGINATAMHYALMIMVAITTVANFEAVGSILVIAMLIVPALTAHLLTDRLGVMIGLSLLLATASGVFGHLAAIYGPGWIGLNYSANSSAMMAVVAGALLGFTIFFSPPYGVIARSYRRLALALQISQQDILGLLFRWQEWRESVPASDHVMSRKDLLTAVGNSMLSRRALRTLRRNQEVIVETLPAGILGVRLTPRGQKHATSLIGSHRLWESYLAKHFQLAPDHLHAPAERMEHYISPELRDELREQLTDPTHDPHGKPIPPKK